MLSSSRRASKLFQLLVIAALTVTVRLPFLLHGDRFFDSDEAVEGLMARHVLQGELPVFLWGQHYKGVPEVYLAAAVFSVAGPGVVALKAATLACFVVFVCLQFLLIDAMFSSRIAWMSTAFLIAGPPALVLWSLSANAEIVLTLLAGTVLMLARVRWEKARGRGAVAVGAAAVGFGLWVHQYILYYVVALTVCVLATSPRARGWWRALIAGHGQPTWIRTVTSLIFVIGLVYIAVGAIAFVTGGFEFAPAGVLVSLRSPQKLWRLGGTLMAFFVALRVAAQITQPDRQRQRAAVLSGVIGFLAGYAPAVLDIIRSGVHVPLARMDLRGFVDASPTMAGAIVPMVIGFRSPTTEWLPVSRWFGLVLAPVILAAFVALRSRRISPFFHILLVVVPVFFVVSGSFVDAQSYRYLMPVLASLSVLLAVGIDEISRWSRPGALGALGALILMFGLQQRAWYERLEPDARSPAILECMARHDVRGARADYWLSYKVTFLSKETRIVAPFNGVDRYPPYTAFVASLDASEGDGACRSLLLQ